MHLVARCTNYNSDVEFDLKISLACAEVTLCNGSSSEDQSAAICWLEPAAL